MACPTSLASSGPGEPDGPSPCGEPFPRPHPSTHPGKCRGPDPRPATEDSLARTTFFKLLIWKPLLSRAWEDPVLPYPEAGCSLGRPGRESEGRGRYRSSCESGDPRGQRRRVLPGGGSKCGCASGPTRSIGRGRSPYVEVDTGSKRGSGKGMSARWSAMAEELERVIPVRSNRGAERTGSGVWRREGRRASGGIRVPRPRAVGIPRGRGGWTPQVQGIGPIGSLRREGANPTILSRGMQLMGEDGAAGMHR